MSETCDFAELSAADGVIAAAAMREREAVAS